MMDSEATFKTRVTEVGLGAYQQKFVDLGWDTFGNFAFAPVALPGAADPLAGKTFDDDVVKSLLGDMVHVDKARVRRLHFEASLHIGCSRHFAEDVMSRGQDDPHADCHV